MPDDRMSPTQKLHASRLIELFLRLVSADDVRQLVLEMEEELAKPIHLSVVAAETVLPFEKKSKETPQTALGPDLLREETTALGAATKPMNDEPAGTLRPPAPPP